MYALCEIRDTIRVPPDKFESNLEKSMLKIIQEEYEGLVDEDLGVIVAVNDVKNVGEGKVIPGEGAAYYSADFELLVYKPEVQEVVEGFVSEVAEFGAFLRTGPVEGLIHVSQIMDDYINYDGKLPGFVGKSSKKKLVVNDEVIARVISVSLKGSIAESKIGLTMRQPFLGKEEWQKIDEKLKLREKPKPQEKKQVKQAPDRRPEKK